MFEVFLVIRGGLIKVFFRQIEVGKSLAVAVNQLLVALVLFHRLVKHLDSLVVLLIVLQSRTIIGVVETRELRTVRGVEKCIGILQSLGSALHVGKVIERKTIPGGLTWVARKSVECHFQTLITLLQHPRLSSVVGDVHIFEFALVGYLVIILQALLHAVRGVENTAG